MILRGSLDWHYSILIISMIDSKTVQAAEPSPQVLNEEIKEKEINSRASPAVPDLESEVLQVELSDFRLIILGAAFLALWATNVRPFFTQDLRQSGINRTGYKYTPDCYDLAGHCGGIWCFEKSSPVGRS